MTDYSHQPVLLQEVFTYLAIKPEGIYVDATFGRGGHSLAILKRLDAKGRLFAIDKDPLAIDFARKTKDFNSRQFTIYHGSFAELKTYLTAEGVYGKVNGLLLDLGVCSGQLDNAMRGFSFLRDGPLDMRMNPQQGVSAATWLNDVSAKDLAEVLRVYGEERYAQRIAQAIIKARPLFTTKELAEVVAKANPRWEMHKHPATRTFQAIRIKINNELEELGACLQQSLEALTNGGRLLVISFHSLEDRIVKQFMRKYCQDNLPSYLPLKHEDIKPKARLVTKLIKPSEQEILINVRARSALLRIMEKIA